MSASEFIAEALRKRKSFSFILSIDLLKSAGIITFAEITLIQNLMSKVYKFALITLISLFSATVFSSCDKDEPEPPLPAGSRTILVYMVANNSLGGATPDTGFDAADRSEMLAAARSGDLNGCRWLVYYASKHSAPVLEELTPNGFTTLKNYDNNSYSVSINRMKDVFADMKKFAPAEEYGLILWSHANGWQQNGIIEKNKKPLAYGEDRGRMMNITSLRNALEGQGFNFLYADVCYFSTIEVVYELRNTVKYFAGCEARLRADGMPYNTTMKYFTGKTADLVSAAASTYAYYNDLSDPDDRWCTMSVIKMDGVEKLAEITRDIYTTSYYPRNYTPQVMEDLSTCYYFDFQHFVEALNSQYYSAWQKAIDDVVIYKAATAKLIGGTPIKTHCGLSTYIMPDEIHATYKNYNSLSWYNDVAQYQPLP